MTDATPLLEIRQLSIGYPGPLGPVQALSALDFSLQPNEVVGLVGESGSGKSQLLLATLGLLAPAAQCTGSIRYHGQELLGASERTLGSVRGRRIAMVFQDPMTALNPYLTIERQLTEGVMHHQGLARRAARERALALLVDVQISDPAARLDQYPHQLSGGMRQRVVLAMAMIAEPEILLADEPTTALDVTVQAEILRLLGSLRIQTGAAIVLVTHDLAVIAELADRVCVMYAGRIVEQAPVMELFGRSHHPYTEGLRRSLPSLADPIPERLPAIPGQPPDAARLPTGCAFAPRCLYRMDRCIQHRPLPRTVGEGHQVACHHEGALGRETGSAAGALPDEARS